jgi:hypothetical protein
MTGIFFCSGLRSFIPMKFLPDERRDNLNTMPARMSADPERRDSDGSFVQDGGSIEGLYLYVKVFSQRHGVFSQVCHGSGDGITGISFPAVPAEDRHGKPAVSLFAAKLLLFFREHTSDALIPD